jgi:hypothetical protein
MNTDLTSAQHLTLDKLSNKRSLPFKGMRVVGYSLGAVILRDVQNRRWMLERSGRLLRHSEAYVHPPTTKKTKRAYSHSVRTFQLSPAERVAYENGRPA